MLRSIANFFVSVIALVGMIVYFVMFVGLLGFVGLILWACLVIGFIIDLFRSRKK